MHEVRKTVTILFADVVASTALGEQLDPEALRAVMTRYFRDMADVVDAHGGTVEKFIGDEVMAVFGVPVAHEDDALRAVRAAVAMQARLHELNDEIGARWKARLEIRIGVNTGEVIAGDPAAGHGFVTGDAVNLAKRIEQAAAPGEVLIGETTSRLVSHVVALTAVEPLTVKGKSDAVRPHRVVQVGATTDALPRRFDAPLVGRTAELRTLRFAYARALETAQPQLVTVLGPAGIGKSRLAREMLEEVGHEANVLVGRCPPYGEGITFWPVRDILPGETLEGTTEEIFWRVRAKVQEIAGERPLVVCFEDVHWAEPTFLDLVQYLAGWIRDARVLLLCLARPELLEQRPDWSTTGSDAVSIRLGRLGADDTEALLDHLGTRDELRRPITEAAEGNPLYVEQIAAMAADHGADVAIPPTIRALLTARLDRLGQSERAVIERAAVVGREFPLRAVMHLSPTELRPDVSPLLLALVRKELVRPQAHGEDDRFRFRHALIRDAAYDAMPKRMRADLHERHADWLHEARGNDVVVGYHLEQAVRLRRELALTGERTENLALRAGLLIGDAGRRAFGRNDVPAAINLLGRAVTLLERQPERLAAPLTELATSLGTAGRLTDADDVLEHALAVASQTGDRRSELRAMLLREQLRSFTANPETDHEYESAATRAIPELERLGDDLGLATAWRLASNADVMACRWALRTEKLERALAHARHVPDAPQERSSLVAVLTQALYYGPTPAPAVMARYQELLEEASDDPAVRAAVLAFLGGLQAMGGAFEDAHRSYDESGALHEELGLRFRKAVVSLVGAEIATLEGDLEEAERQLREGCDTLERIGASGVRAALVVVLADLVCSDGRDSEAAELAVLASELAEPGDVLVEALSATTRGRVDSRSGNTVDGTALVRTAVDRARTTDFPVLQAMTLVAFSEVVGSDGDNAAAQESLERAWTLYRGKGNVVAADRLRERLATGETRG